MFKEAKLGRHFVSSHLQFSISELPKYAYFLRILANFGLGLNSSSGYISNHRKSSQFFGLPVRQPGLYFVGLLVL